jgi:hypothetical protein
MGALEEFAFHRAGLALRTWMPQQAIGREHCDPIAATFVRS